MKRIFLTMVLAASVVTGCDATDTGSATFTSDDLSIVGTDECEFFVANQAYEFVITVVGSTVTVLVEELLNVPNEPNPQFELTADDYDPMEDQVRVTGLSVNAGADRDPCVVELDDVMLLTLGNPALSLEEQDSISVVWNHGEKDISSAWDNACTLDENGDQRVDENEDPITLWFNELPCSGEANLTMTLQQP